MQLQVPTEDGAAGTVLFYGVARMALQGRSCRDGVRVLACDRAVSDRAPIHQDQIRDVEASRRRDQQHNRLIVSASATPRAPRDNGEAGRGSRRGRAGEGPGEGAEREGRGEGPGEGAEREGRGEGPGEGAEREGRGEGPGEGAGRGGWARGEVAGPEKRAGNQKPLERAEDEAETGAGAGRGWGCRSRAGETGLGETQLSGS